MRCSCLTAFLAQQLAVAGWAAPVAAAGLHEVRPTLRAGVVALPSVAGLLEQRALSGCLLAAHGPEQVALRAGRILPMGRLPLPRFPVATLTPAAAELLLSLHQPYVARPQAQ